MSSLLFNAENRPGRLEVYSQLCHIVCLLCFTINVSVSAWLCNPGIPVPSAVIRERKGVLKWIISRFLLILNIAYL